MPTELIVALRPRLRILLVALAASVLAVHAASACSLGPPWVDRDKGLVAFIGTALADTVLVGPGAMSPVMAMGHYGRGAPRAPYGQRFRLDQLGADARTRFPADAREAVIVPWDYDASCRTVAWGRSSRWIAPGTRGLYRAQLRSRELWVDGRPTFDLLGTMYMPYGSLGPFERASDTARVAKMSAEALLRLYDDLPPPDPFPDSIAALALMRRLAADTVTAKLYPLSNVISGLGGEYQSARAHGVVAPVAGTFRLELSRDGGPVDTLFLRLDDGVTTLDEDETRPFTHDGLVPPTPRGYYIYTTVGIRLDELAPNCRVRSAHRLAYVDLDWHAPARMTAIGEWRGGLDEVLIEPLLPADTIRAWHARQAVLWAELADSVRSATPPGRDEQYPAFVPDRPLRFVQGPAGPMRVEGVMTFNALGTYRIRGERISLEVLDCDF